MRLYLPSRILLCMLALASATALGGAYIAQYYFGLHPCHLCLLQRYPYMAVVVLAALGTQLPVRAQRWIILLCTVLFLLDAGIAAYHAGVEWHLFPGPDSCTTQGGADSLEALRKQISGAPLVACDQPQAELFGLTFAAWNALYAASLAIFTVLRRRNA